MGCVIAHTNVHLWFGASMIIAAAHKSSIFRGHFLPSFTYFPGTQLTVCKLWVDFCAIQHAKSAQPSSHKRQADACAVLSRTGVAVRPAPPHQRLQHYVALEPLTLRNPVAGQPSVAPCSSSDQQQQQHVARKMRMQLGTFLYHMPSRAPLRPLPDTMARCFCRQHAHG